MHLTTRQDGNENAPHQPPFTCVADDLTGALEVASRVPGSSVLISSLGQPHQRQRSAGPLNSPLVVDADCRGSRGTEVCERMSRALALFQARGLTGAPDFLKVDSAMRGSVMEMAEQLRRAAGRDWALVCPANPSTGRGFVGGQVVSAGEPISIGCAGHVTKAVCTRASLDEVRRGRLALSRAIAELVSKGSRAILCDADSCNDLSAIAWAMAEAGGLTKTRPLAVGSAGLASSVLGARESGETGYSAADSLGDRGRILLVCGSWNRTCREQVRALARTGVRVFELDGGTIGSVPAEPRISSAIGAAIGEARVVILSTAGSAVSEDDPGVARALASIAHGAVLGVRDCRLFATGGDTARALCAAWNCHTLTQPREVVKGIVGSFMPGGRRLYTKPGSYGDSRSLVCFVERIISQ